MREVQIDSCAVSVTELEPGMLTSYHCRRGHPSAVVTAAGVGRLAPVDRKLPPGTSVVSCVPFRRMVSMVAVPGAVFVMMRLSVVVVQEGDSAAAVAEAERVSGLMGVGSRTATVGSEPVNFTCVPEAMYASVLTRASLLPREVLVGTSVMMAVYTVLPDAAPTVAGGTSSVLASVEEPNTAVAPLRRYAPDGQRGSVIAEMRKTRLLPKVPLSPEIVTVKGTPMYVVAEDADIAVGECGVRDGG